MRYILLLILMLFYFIIHSQNIIQNGGFESLELDPNDSTVQYTNWTKLLKYKTGHEKFSEYKKKLDGQKLFHFYSKDDLLDFESPFEGDGCLRFGASLKAFYQQKLIAPLKKDSFYCLRLKYKILSDNIPPEEVIEKVKNNIGVSFTIVDFRDSSKLKLLNKSTFTFPWHYTLNNFSYDQNEKWVNFEIYFKAKLDYKFIIIGNNKYLTNFAITRPWKGISYRMDNIELIQVSEADTIKQKPSNEKIFKPKTININDTISKLILSNFVENDSIHQYYIHIYKAENLILNKNFEESFKEYLLAFDYKTPFYRDFLNTNKLISKLNILDSIQMRKYLILSSKISKMTIIDRIEYLQAQDQIFKTSYLDYFKTDTSFDRYTYINHIDSTLLKKIKRMLDSDQASRNSNKEIAQTDMKNYQELLEVMNENIEISERTIGKNGMIDLYIILLHLSRYKTMDWIIPLLKLVEKGYFENRIFASLVDSYITNNYYSDPVKSLFLSNIAFPLYSKYLIPRLDKKIIREKNSIRNMIYLESIKDQQKKQLYNYRHGYKNFEFYIVMTYGAQNSDSIIQEKEALLQELEIINQLKSKYKELIILDRDSNNYDVDFK